MIQRWSRLRRGVVGTGLAAGLVGGLVLIVFPGIAGTNFHPVLPGRVYRSAQLSPAELEAVIDRHGIRTIINLRGAEPGARWYDAEVEVARRRGVVLYDLDLPADRLPPRPMVERLIGWLESAPGPVLVHCGAGADRSGLASALARLAVEGAPLDAARAELTMAYGHVPFGPSAEVDRFLDLFGAYLGARSAVATPARLKTWLADHYVPYFYSARIEPLAFPATARAGGPLEARVRVTNLSPEPWALSTDADRGVKLGFRIQPEGASGWRDFDRAAAAGVVPPGGTVEIDRALRAPGAAGRYRLKVDMVDERVTWFEDQGSRALILPFDVR